MYDKNELCKKIRKIFPDIGECGIDVKIDYDDEKKAYIVDLKKGQHKLKTYLEQARNYILLDPTISKKGKKDPKWRVIVNWDDL